MRRLLAALLFVLPVAPHALAAQPATQAWLLRPGARVRVTYAGQAARVGTLVSLTDDTLAVQWVNNTDTARMARARATRIAVSRGIRPSSRAARAKIGMIVGAGGVLLLAEASGGDDTGNLAELSEGLMTMMGAALAGGVGALIGAATGGPSEEWEDVSLTTPRVGLVTPSRDHDPGIGSAPTF
jgi:hypothetical protein